MIIISASGRVKPGRKQELLELAGPLVSASQAEAGNISYHLCEGVDDPDAVMFLEEWKDQAAIDFHTKTEHYTTILPKIGELFDGEINIALYKRAI